MLLVVCAAAASALARGRAAPLTGTNGRSVSLRLVFPGSLPPDQPEILRWMSPTALNRLVPRFHPRWRSTAPSAATAASAATRATRPLAAR